MNHKTIPILRPGTRLSVIREQIDAIQTIALPIANWLLAALVNNAGGGHADGEGWKKDGQPIRGEALVAAELLFCKACGKLEAILDDPRLLSTEDHDSAEKATLRMVEENTKMIQAQRQGLEWANSPAARFEPMLVRMEENFWTAVLGDLTNQANMVCGIGSSPDAALKNFNDVFSGRVSEPLLFYAEIREKALAQNPNEAPPPIFDGKQIPPDTKP